MPPQPVQRLTLSGNEITDDVRALGSSGDGRTAGSGLGIWEAATNLVPNGGFETNTANVGTYGTATVSRVSSRAKFGMYSLEVRDAANDAGATMHVGGTLVVATATVYTTSAWVYAEADVTVRLVFREMDATGGWINQSFVDVVPNGEWIRAVVTHTTTSGVRGEPWVLNFSGTVKTFYVDAVQIEQQPLATPYAHTDGASAARADSRVQAPASLLDETQGWIAARLRAGWANTADPSGNPVLFDWRDDVNNLLQVRFDTLTNTWELQRRATAGTGEVTKADTFAPSEAITVIAAWDATNLKLSVDGSVFASVAAANIPALAASLFDVGSVSGTSEHIDSDILWFACGTGTFADVDAARLGAAPNTTPWNYIGHTAKMTGCFPRPGYTLLQPPIYI